MKQKKSKTEAVSDRRLGIAVCAFGVVCAALAWAHLAGYVLPPSEKAQLAKLEVATPINPVEKLQAVTVHVDVANGGGGSGVVIRRVDGLGQERTFVWTAYHVIEGYENEAKVTRDWVYEGALIGLAEFTTKLVAFDESLDLALLEVDGPGFMQGAVISTDLRPMLGDPIIHVGNFCGHSFSFSLSVSKGIVSRRSIHLGLDPGSVVHYVQTDATIWPGSSGGGVYNEDGECVGIVTRSAGPGIGFFVPVYYLWRFALDYNVPWAFRGETCPTNISYIDEVVDMDLPEELRGLRGVTIRIPAPSE